MNRLLRLVAAAILGLVFHAQSVADEVWTFQFTPTGSRPFSGYCFGDCVSDFYTRADVAGTFSILLNRQTGAGRPLRLDTNLFNFARPVETPDGTEFQPIQAPNDTTIGADLDRFPGHFHYQQNGLWRLIPDGFSPTQGSFDKPYQYDIWFTLTAATFSTQLPDSPYSYPHIQGAFASLVSVTTAGDFNGDGRVNGSDYVSWRKSGRSALDYKLWRNFYGFGSAAGLSSDMVPEPPAILLVGMGLLTTAGICSRRRNRVAK